MSYDFNPTEIDCPECHEVKLLDDWVNFNFWCSTCQKLFAYNPKTRKIKK